jgi:hypothetical protein
MKHQELKEPIMGQDDVGKAVEAMSADMDVAQRLAAGDFTDLPEAELTDAERAMVSAAADDIPDVAGFAAFIKYDGVDRESRAVFPKLEIDLQSPFGAALRYANYGWKV